MSYSLSPVWTLTCKSRVRAPTRLEWLEWLKSWLVPPLARYVIIDSFEPWFIITAIIKSLDQRVQAAHHMTLPPPDPDEDGEKKFGTFAPSFSTLDWVACRRNMSILIKI